VEHALMADNIHLPWPATGSIVFITFTVIPFFFLILFKNTKKDKQS
jgi:hypothetical protein